VLFKTSSDKISVTAPVPTPKVRAEDDPVMVWYVTFPVLIWIVLESITAALITLKALLVIGYPKTCILSISISTLLAVEKFPELEKEYIPVVLYVKKEDEKIEELSKIEAVGTFVLVWTKLALYISYPRGDEETYDAVIAYDEVKLFITPGPPFIEPVILKDPERETSYADIPLKASIDWVTCHASTVFPVVMPDFENVFAI